MKLQDRVIERYHLFFPKETLKSSSARTGIQLTRIHRIFHGKPMRLQEFEAFEKAIHEKLNENPASLRLNHIMEEAAALFTNQELAKIADYMERRVANKKYSRIYVSPLFQDASIA